MMGHCLLTISLTFGKSGDTSVTDLKTGSFFGNGPRTGLTITGNIIYEKYIISHKYALTFTTFTEKCRPYLSYIILASALIK